MPILHSLQSHCGITEQIKHDTHPKIFLEFLIVRNLMPEQPNKIQ